MTDPAGQPEPALSTEEPVEELPQGRLKSATPDADASSANPSAKAGPAPRWPFAAGSQNQTEKAVKLKPYVPPKRRGLNQY